MFKNSLWLVWTLASLSLMGCPGGGMPDAGAGGGGGQSDGGCVGGQLGCACGTTACSVGECVNKVCTDCKRGDLACACFANDSCKVGLQCTTGLCAACPEGTNGCACGTGDTCNAGLKCSTGTCAPDTCVMGATGCPCRSTDPKCDGTMYCSGMSLCTACSADIVGCGCGSGNVCGGGLVCDTTAIKCRAPITCATLKTMGTCKANQLCNDATGVDGVCVANTCEPQFKWDPGAMGCLACLSTDCANEPSCTAADGGVSDAGLTATCNALNRTCSQTGAIAACGVCSMGFTPASADAGVNTACVVAPVCGTQTCTVNEYCDRTGGTPTCTTLPCPSGQAKDTLPDGGVAPGATCAVCAKNCMAEGFTGRIWPFKSYVSGSCLCETQSGYYLPTAGQATICDADNDGWVREEADDNSIRADPQLEANSRCKIKSVDRVRLEDEYAVSVEVKSCTTGLLKNPTAAECPAIVPMRLLETLRNDIPARPGATNKAPAYGGTGRFLEANELNSVTKACVSVAGDYNENGIDDMDEIQKQVVPSDTDRIRLESFAYFVELYTAFHEAPAVGTGPGVLVIKERSRCNLNEFPLRYDKSITDAGSTADRYSVDAGSPYWRNCARRRDSSFNLGTPIPGNDFGQWLCDGGTGTCPTVAPAVATMTIPLADGGLPDPRSTLVRNFGLCELNGARPLDNVWRGMTAHSQFKCVNVTNNAPVKAYDRATAAFSGASAQTFNNCLPAACASPTTCGVAQGSGTQTRTPSLRCLAVNPIVGQVGFAAQPYTPYGTSPPLPNTYTGGNYLNGCVNEDAETLLTAIPALAGFVTYTCPNPEYFLTKADSDANFGRYSCWGKLPAFLWSENPPLPVTQQRAILKWGVNAADMLNGYLR